MSRASAAPSTASRTTTSAPSSSLSSPQFQGSMGIGVISDTDSQPLIINSHLGTFGIVTVGKINNIEELGRRAFSQRKYFSETLTAFDINPTELIAMLICEEDNFVDGIRHVHDSIKGSCTMLILTREGIYAARDRLRQDAAS
ncbi:MAG: hypothetical protein MZU95_00020 [Desulfomicrobium escambiense]|nr:hypothetical protein [Desulfomicrobium escambiense]